MRPPPKRTAIAVVGAIAAVVAPAVVVAMVAAVTALAARTGSDPPPVRAQPPPETAFVPRSPTGTPTPRPPEACGLVIESAVVEPRILGPGMQATVRLHASFDLGAHPTAIRDRIIVVVGPVADDLSPIVTAALARLAETVELERGNELAVIAVGAEADPLVWWSGEVGLDGARRALAALPRGDRSTADWVRAVEVASDALLSGPPTKSTALLVVADRRPAPPGPIVDWRGHGIRLRDALVQRTVVELSEQSWLNTLVVGESGGLHRLNSMSRDPVVATNVLRGARQRLLGLTGVGLGYLLELGDGRWRAFPIPAIPAEGQTMGEKFVTWFEGIDTWSGAFAMGYGIAPTSGLRARAERVVPLADGRHTLFLQLGSRGSCEVWLNVGNLCIHNRDRLEDDCGSFTAGETATAGAPTRSPIPSATATPTLPPASPSPRATSTPTPHPWPSPSPSVPRTTAVASSAAPANFVIRLPIARRSE